MQRRNWWNVAEAITIVATIAGSIGAEVLRQSLFLSAPLSATLLLNFLNRRQANETMQKQIDREISQLRRDFYQLDQYVLENMGAGSQQAGPPIHSPESIYPVKATLEPPVALTVRNSYHPGSDDGKSSGAEELVVRELTLAEERSLTPLLMMQAQLLQLNQRVEQLARLAPAEELATQVTTLATIVEKLEQRTNTLPPAKEMTAMISAIKTLYQRQTNLEREITQAIQQEIQGNLAALAGAQEDRLQAKMAQLNAEVATLKQQYDLSNNHSQPPKLAMVQLTHGQSTNGQSADGSPPYSPTVNGSPIGSTDMNGNSDYATEQPVVHGAALQDSTAKRASDLAKQRFEDLATAIVQLEKDLDNPALKKHLTLLASALYTASVKSQS